MENSKEKFGLGKLIGGLFLVSVIAASIYGAFNSRQVLDYIALRNYTPSEQIAQLATDTTMEDATRRVFYVNRPELNDKNAFRDRCPSGSHSLVLGCYIQHRGIFLLKVEDPRLDGVIQVTAAHEILHAQYDRLSGDERKNVDRMTSTFFATLQNDRIKETVEQYKQKDPSVVPNELHSILATEVRTLSPELEEYYSKYFANRAKIVEFSEKYEQTFVALSDEVDRYDKQLESLKENINSNQAKIDALSVDIEQQKALLDDLINSDRTDVYNQEVPAFNQLVREYNALIERTRAQISEHNELVEKRNSIVVTEQELVEAINSNITTKETE